MVLPFIRLFYLNVFNEMVIMRFSRLKRLLNLLFQHLTRRKLCQILRYFDARLIKLKQFNLLITALSTQQQAKWSFLSLFHLILLEPPQV